MIMESIPFTDLPPNQYFAHDDHAFIRVGAGPNALRLGSLTSDSMSPDLITLDPETPVKPMSGTLTLTTTHILEKPWKK